jgi:hypothetical protein
MAVSKVGKSSPGFSSPFVHTTFFYAATFWFSGEGESLGQKGAQKPNSHS